MRDTEYISGLPTDNPWNVATETKLIELWATGMSTAKIAVELGPEFTKRAVVGKVHRLRLPSRDSPIIQSDEPKPPAPSRYLDVNRRSLPPLPAVADMAYVHRPAAPSFHRKCQYPHGENPPYRFCHEPVKEGSSYCPEHHALCHVKREPARL